MTYYILMGMAAYLIGSINFSIILSKKMAGFDVREKGSGNAGTTNMLRAVGKKAAAITLVLDILKGIISVVLAVLLGKLCSNVIINDLNTATLVQIAGICVILGHIFPIFFGFKGGKGIATALGILLITNWQIGLICLVFALVIIIITKMVSVGSIGAAILFPILTLFLGKEKFIVSGNYIIFSILIVLIVCFTHRENIKRLMNGTENKLSFKKK